MFSRTQRLLGKAAIDRLTGAKILLFGVGGVGSFTLEALVRAGVGTIHIVDNDTVAESNLNRQLIALQSNIGMPKVEVATIRARDINPDINIVPHQTFFLPENASAFDFSAFDYVIDAIDTVTAKIAIISAAKAAGVPVISSMGTGNKLYADRFRITDISKTSVCPLARVMRRELKARHITKVKVLWSDEPPINCAANGGAVVGDCVTKGRAPAENCVTEGAAVALSGATEGGANCAANGTAGCANCVTEGAVAEKVPLKGNGPAPASCSFVPSVAGLLIAGEVVRDLCAIS